MDIKRRTLLKAAPLVFASPLFAHAQSKYPAKAIRYIVPLAPGGGADLVGRTLTDRWSKALGQSIVVENMGGGGGAIGTQAAAKAAPDGYTLLQGYVATHGTNPATRRVPYDPIKDFTPIGMIGGTPNVLVVGPNVPARNLKEFVEYVRKSGGKLNYGSAGPGSLTHLTMELFLDQMKLDMTHIGYRGIAPAITDVLAGETQAMFPGLAAALPQIRAGRLKPIAVTGNVRHPLLKDVPTLVESGLKGFDAMQWYGVVGPAGMPADVVKHLNDTLNGVLSSPELKEKLVAEALDPIPMKPDQFGQFIRSEIARWGKVAKERNIILD